VVARKIKMELPLYKHLGELRKRIIVIALFLFIFSLIGFCFSGLVMKVVINNLVVENVKIVGLSPIEYVSAKIKISLLIGFLITTPLIIYEAIVFIFPGLSSRERKAIMLVLPSFILLFLAGVCFSYFIFLPLAISFLGNLGKGVIENMWSINKLISFVVYTCALFGCIFQLPLLLLLLQKLNILNIKILKKYRAHIYVGIFIVSAIVTPPDVVTQLGIALPIILLYEGSLLLAKIL